jgi:hypothetical protein
LEPTALSSRKQSNIIPLISAEGLGYVWDAMKLLDRVRDVGLRRRPARSTIACYQSWISEFLASAAWRGDGVRPVMTHAIGKPRRRATHIATRTADFRKLPKTSDLGASSQLRGAVETERREMSRNVSVRGKVQNEATTPITLPPGRESRGLTPDYRS